MDGDSEENNNGEGEDGEENNDSEDLDDDGEENNNAMSFLSRESCILCI